MNNLVVQLLLKTGTFSTDLKTARGQVQQFQQGCQHAGQSLDGFTKGLGLNVGALTKLGGAVGAAVIAGKAFKAVLDSNQTSADAFQGVIAGCKGVVDGLAQAVATADFSSFRDGIWSVYDAAKAARDALDNLQDASLAFGYKSKKNRTVFNEAYNVLKDPNATEDMKEAAKQQMKAAVDAQKEYAMAYGKKEMDAYKAMIIKEVGSSNISANNITNAQFERAMDIKLGLEGDTGQVEYELDRKYKEFRSKLRKYGKNNITAQEQLKKEYADVIAIRAMVKLMSDEELKSATDIIGGMEDAKQSAQALEKTMLRATGADDRAKNTNHNTKSIKEEIEVQEESLDYWKKIQQEAQKHRDAEVFNSDSWNSYNETMVKAEKKIEELTSKAERLKTTIRFSADILKPVTGTEQVHGTAVVNKKEGLAGETKKSIADIEKSLSIYQDKQKTTFDPELLKHYNQRMKELREELERMNNLGLEEVASPKVVDTWDEFNNAMASTSTIVGNLADAFQDGTKVTTASILKMVSTSLPALSSLISALAALAGVEATEKAVSTSKHWIEAIAAVAALGAAVATALSVSKKGGKFANGGIVGGTSFTGDRVTAQVNSGEMILNKTQQARLFKLANGGGLGGSQVEFHISGTELVGVLNNTNRKNNLIR